MTDWLLRAKLEIPKSTGMYTAKTAIRGLNDLQFEKNPDQGTAVTAVRNLTAVTAVEELEIIDISKDSSGSNDSDITSQSQNFKPSFVANGSTLPGHFSNFQSSNLIDKSSIGSNDSMLPTHFQKIDQRSNASEMPVIRTDTEDRKNKVSNGSIGGTLTGHFQKIELGHDNNWSIETALMIEWFQNETNLPAKAFLLKPAVWVSEPSKFYESLREDIAAGPHGCRAMFGALQNDLKALKTLTHKDKK